MTRINSNGKTQGHGDLIFGPWRNIKLCWN